MSRGESVPCRSMAAPAFLYSPGRGEYLVLAEQGVRVPIATIMAGDTLTPVLALLRLGAKAPCFLLESVEKGAYLGRYSFLGLGRKLLDRREGELVPGDPLAEVRRLLEARAVRPTPGFAPFAGGLVGYLGYELNRFWEPVLPAPIPPMNDPVADLPLLSLMQAEELVIFDHTSQTIHLVAHPSPDLDPREAYDEAVARLEQLRARLSRPLFPAERPLEMGGAPADLAMEEEWTRRGFCRGVEQAQEYIRAGEIFQVVLSRRFSLPAPTDALTLYRVLRKVNPSPYLFYLDFGGFQLVGSSPEMLTRMSGDTA